MLTATAERSRARPALLLALVAAAVATTFIVIGFRYLTTSDPQPRVYVSGTSGNPVFGYQPCGLERVRRFTVYAASGSHVQNLWVAMSTTSSADQVRFEYGHAPVGYETAAGPLSFPARGRIGFRFELNDGQIQGLQVARDDIRPGQILWAGGHLKATDLSSVPRHDLGC